MVRIWIAAGIAAWFIIAAVSIYKAQAQSGVITGPSGEFLGSYHRQGPTTTYQGSAGEFLGSSHRFGNTRTFQGPTGQYEGAITGDRVRPRGFNRFDRFERED